MVDNMGMVDNMDMVDNMNIVDVGMVILQKNYGYLKLLVDTSV